MNRAAALFEKLGDADADWIFSHAVERQLLKDEPLITAGKEVDALSIVVKGLLGVFGPGGGERLAVVGPGGVVGEMSLLEERVPTESVVALETTAVLVLPHRALEEKFARDPRFAAGLLRGMAKSLSQRLRRTNARLAVAAAAPEPAGADGGDAAGRVSRALLELEGLIHRANEAALRNKDTVPAEVAREVGERFARFYALLDETAGEGSPEREDVRERIGLQAQKQLLPYVLLTRTAERAFSKPRGYPGDFQTVDAIQQNTARGVSRIGPMLDRVFLDAPVSAAIRERRRALAEEIGRAVAEADGGGPARVTALACGPGGEVLDAFAALDDPARLQATLVDFDPQALALVSERLRERPAVRPHVAMRAVNPVFLALGRTEVEVEPQDLVFVPGLADYFDHALVVKLFSLLHGMLKPGGRALVGALHPANPSRAFLDHVLEWRLAHRTEEELDRLCAASAFGRPCDRVRRDPAGIGLLAEVTRDA